MAMILMCSVSMPAKAQTYSDTWMYSTEYIDAINYVSDNGYMVGGGNGKFNPGESMTRAMIVTILYSMAGKPETTYKEEFTDVNEEEYFYKAVCWACENEMAAGNGAGLFSPHSYILKQDAVLMLYKYALSHGFDKERTCQLDEYSDATAVSSYALTAVKWAVESDIFPEKNDTTLAPKAYLTRAEMALLVTKYGLNVEYIVYGKDDYNFQNHEDFFTEEFNYITQEHYLKLCRYIDKIHINDQDIAKSYKKAIADLRNQPWVKSGYGMAVTTILDKMGKINFNRTFATEAATMHDIDPKKVEGCIVESAINYYNLVPYISLSGSLPNPRSIQHEGTALYDLVELCKKERGLKLFTYTVQSGISYVGHTVVAYDIIEGVGGIYQILAYDSRNVLAAPVIITVDTKEKKCTVTNGLDKNGNKIKDTAATYSVVTDFSVFDLVDIETENSSIPPYGVIDKKGVAIFRIDLSGNFSLTNAEGETLTCRDAWLSGDMDIISYQIIGNGPDAPAQMMICVEGSDSYSYKALTEGMSTGLTLCNGYGYAAVEGTNIEEIQIDSTNRMTLIGEAMEYDITYEDNEGES